MKCCICGIDIGKENRSEEHIIHNAIGGILKSQAIYCKECNSKYGSDTDKAFTEIFAPIIDGLDMNFDRKTGKTSYEGIMCDKEGNLYKARLKNGKVMSMCDKEGKYKSWESEKYQKIAFNFNLDNESYKKGMAKIAFNFAIYSDVDVNKLNRVFDGENKELMNKPTIIPFAPMTLFDSMIEAQDTNNLFHVLRLFNYGKFLYAYVELFSTFQVYVLLSDNYSGEIYKEYCQIINKNDSEGRKKELMDSLKIWDYKDANIIATQYQIDIKKVIEDLKKYHGYNGENINVVFEAIQKMAYDKIRKKSYERNYLEILGEKYAKANFINIFNLIDNEEKMRLYSEFQYYTCYVEDAINIERYKMFLYLDNQQYLYPEFLAGVMFVKPSVFKSYGHFKFSILMNHLKNA